MQIRNIRSKQLRSSAAAIFILPTQKNIVNILFAAKSAIFFYICKLILIISPNCRQPTHGPRTFICTICFYNAVIFC